MTWANRRFVRRNARSPTRPVWRTALDTAVFLLVLAVALRGLAQYGVIDVGSGNARAMDGDSLTLNGTEVRLQGIDAPELNQTCGSNDGEYPCGREARDALRDLLRGRTISCRSLEADRYGRAVSVCREGTLEINAEMVRQGWAVAYLRHDAVYLPQQLEAKAARRGIWRGPFELPENYRARHRNITSGFDE